MTIQPTTRLHNGRVLLLHGKAEDRLKQIKDNYVDLTVTSPPYDDLRTYNGFSFNFEAIANELYRVTKVGGIVVWVISDQTKDFCESLTSFRQAIYFVDRCGFKLLDTMIYEKSSYAPAYPNMRKYAQVVEYMFIFCKGSPKTFNQQRELKANSSIRLNGRSSFRNRDGTITKDTSVNRANDTKAKTNLWRYSPGNDPDRSKFAHPATFPDQLASDHILSWSNPDDIVLDPFMGSGTTGKMAILNNRRFIGIDLSEEYITDIALPRCQQAINSMASNEVSDDRS